MEKNNNTNMEENNNNTNMEENNNNNTNMEENNNTNNNISMEENNNTNNNNNNTSVSNDHFYPQNEQRTNLFNNWKKQIFKEEKRFIILSIINWSLFLGFLVISVMWILKWSKAIKVEINNFFLLNPWFVIPITIFFLVLLIKISLDWYRFRREKEIHFDDSGQYNFDRVPNFVISIYKRYQATLIFCRWWLFSSLIICSLFLIYAILSDINKEIEFNFLLSRIKIINQASYVWEITVVAIYLAFVIGINLWIWIKYNKEMSKILAIFDIKKVYTEVDSNSHKRKVHIFCFCLFLLPLLIILVLRFLIKKVVKR